MQRKSKFKIGDHVITICDWWAKGMSGTVSDKYNGDSLEIRLDKPVRLDKLVGKITTPYIYAKEHECRYYHIKASDLIKELKNA